MPYTKKSCIKTRILDQIKVIIFTKCFLVLATKSVSQT